MADADAGTDREPRRWRSRGGLVTMATVASLVAGMGLTVLGSGRCRSGGGELRRRVLGVEPGPGRDGPDQRCHRPGGHPGGRADGPRSPDAGQPDGPVRDPAGPAPPGRSARWTCRRCRSPRRHRPPPVSVSAWPCTKDAAFVIDAVQGIVRQLDPRTLTPIGEPIRYPPGITGGIFDGTGRLWIAVPGEGTVSAITPAPLPSDGPAGGVAGGRRTAPGADRRRRRRPVTIWPSPPSTAASRC